MVGPIYDNRTSWLPHQTTSQQRTIMNMGNERSIYQSGKIRCQRLERIRCQTLRSVQTTRTSPSSLFHQSGTCRARLPASLQLHDQPSGKIKMYPQHGMAKQMQATENGSMARAITDRSQMRQPQVAHSTPQYSKTAHGIAQEHTRQDMVLKRLTGHDC